MMYNGENIFRKKKKNEENFLLKSGALEKVLNIVTHKYLMALSVTPVNDINFAKIYLMSEHR